MSRKPPSGRAPESSGGDRWEAEAADTELESGVLPPSEELEQALREATEAIEARSASRGAAAQEEAPGDPGGSGSDEAERIRAELAETHDRWVRLNADFENFRRRTLKEREEAYRFGHQALAKDLLPAVDNLERAIDAARKSGVGDLDSLLQGLELVHRELGLVLAKHGVTEVEAIGKPFDPSLHEAIAQAPDASVPPNTVVQVYQKGYRLLDRLLRPAQVVVARSGDEGAA